MAITCSSPHATGTVIACCVDTREAEISVTRKFKTKVSLRLCRR